ncbi:methylmalonyl Co-A mutase-associated GTPase MeaB [Terasakiella pusilla]|jgi:LAO/AO transport system kinase|uniref:methylmalonyl Co-A mutase-associated GTPase MeaB n=1 Tax=Terasakiella pusilla TaxID=64973 RepID=UPI00068D81F3|nr:methylmalonyl Co-A mutase-associated GTPase MeaB [Terasakiella pusilla]
MNDIVNHSVKKGPVRRRKQLSVDEYVKGVLAGDRTMIGRTISLVESTSPRYRKIAQEVLLKLLPHSGKAHRIGITGVPGVGKSTTIEALGCNLCEAGHKVAVLAVDPTSSVSGGSILGDKTRMNNLAIQENAFIRPSPSSGTLGGVTKMTRETMIVCEAAGFDVVLVETVGVGQSETVVADMVDFFLVLMLPGAGDELQGIKKGVLELADMIAVNKSDGANEKKAKLAARDYKNALHIMKPQSPSWSPPVICVSGLANMNLDDMWAKVQDHREKLTKTGELQEKRTEQQYRWMWAMVEDRLMEALKSHPDVKSQIDSIHDAINNETLTATVGAQRILNAFGLTETL